jgi:Ca2+-binding RTX toxin-like protein
LGGDGGILSLSLGLLPLHGNVTLNTDGTYSYLRHENYLGPDQFTVLVTDVLGVITLNTVSISIAVEAPVEIFGTTGHDVLTGGAADNIIRSGDNNDQVRGGAGDDTLDGGRGADRLDGGAGDDTLDGGTGADLLIGGDGSDTFIIDNVGDVIVEGLSPTGVNTTGYDRALSTVSYTLSDYVGELTLLGSSAIHGTGNFAQNLLNGNGAANSLVGLGGNDTLNGNGGQDVLFGGEGADRLFGGADADRMYGGLGNDIYWVDNASDLASETDAGGLDNGGTDTVNASVSYTLGSFIERLTLTGTAAINGTGNDLNNVLLGNEASNVLQGAAGNDTLNGAAGADTLYGGSGNDTYTVDNIADIASEDGVGGVDAGGLDRVVSSVDVTLGNFIENLQLSGTAAIDGTGNGLNNTLTGNSGDNYLSGLAGADMLSGGAGNDVLLGGAGADRFEFTSLTGSDTVLDFVSGSDKLVFELDVFGSALDANADRRVDAGRFVLGSAALDADDFLFYDQASGRLFYDADGSGTDVDAVLIATLAGGVALAVTDLLVA